MDEFTIRHALKKVSAYLDGWLCQLLLMKTTGITCDVSWKLQKRIG